MSYCILAFVWNIVNYAVLSRRPHVNLPYPHCVMYSLINAPIPRAATWCILLSQLQRMSKSLVGGSNTMQCFKLVTLRKLLVVSHRLAFFFFSFFFFRTFSLQNQLIVWDSFRNQVMRKGKSRVTWQYMLVDGQVFWVWLIRLASGPGFGAWWPRHSSTSPATWRRHLWLS